MATAALVDKNIEIGRQIVAALTLAEIPVTVYLWAFVSEEWLFIVATPLVDSRGSLAAYTEINKALKKAGLPDEVARQKIFLMSPNDRELKLLEKQSKTAPYDAIRTVNASIAGRFVEDAYVYSGSIHVIGPDESTPDEYHIVYVPKGVRGGRAVTLNGIERVKEFLGQEVHIRRDVLGPALRDLKDRGGVSIPNVQLKPHDLRRLRLA